MERCIISSATRYILSLAIDPYQSCKHSCLAAVIYRPTLHHSTSSPEVEPDKEILLTDNK